MKRILLTALSIASLAAAIPLSAFAQDDNQDDNIASHAITMHGTPKYGPNFTHLDYVNPNAPKGGTLKQHAIGTFDSLNPFIVKGTPAAGITFIGQNLIYDSLMEQSYDEPFSMYCLLCETVEHPADNMSVTFNLRKNAKWNDGVPVTADDAVFSFNTFMAEGSPFFKAYYGDVESVTAESPTRVKFTFKHPNNAELAPILGQISIIPKHYWEKSEHVFNETSLLPPLTGGAYTFGKVTPGRSVEYVRNKDYWGKDLPINKGRYNFDRIVYDYYRDSNVALEAFFAGEYDIRQENTAKLWETSYKSAPQVKNGQITMREIAHGRPQGMQGFLYNIRRPVFSNPKVREALAYAFDFEWSNKQFAYGKYKRSESYFANSELASSGTPSEDELAILEPYMNQLPKELFTDNFIVPRSDGSGNNRKNLKKAADLLNEAGFKLGADGIREKDGTKLEFEIVDANPQFERWVSPFLANLKRIGVKANFRVIDPAQYQNRLNNFDFDMTIGSIGQSNSPGNEQRDFWSSEKADIPGSRNYIGIKSPVIDQIIEDLIRAKSREELISYSRALDRILLWNHYVIPQWHIDHWRLAWWDKLEKPSTLSPLTPAITQTWWAKPDTGEESK